MNPVLMTVLKAFLPSLVNLALKFLADGLSWLKQKAAETESPVDDTLVSIFEQAKPALDTAVDSLIIWLYDKAKKTEIDVDDRVLELIAAKRGLPLPGVSG